MPATQRADARRNHARILAVAEDEVAAHGAAASLEQIARVAGVGSATVRRHFPTRQALLEAVSHRQLDALCEQAAALTEWDDSRAALLQWLRDLLGYSVSSRGLAAALVYEGAGPESVYENSCATVIQQSAGPLLERAVQDEAIPAGVTIADLTNLVIGVVLATEHHLDHAAAAGRLLDLAVVGLSPGKG